MASRHPGGLEVQFVKQANQTSARVKSDDGTGGLGSSNNDGRKQQSSSDSNTVSSASHDVSRASLAFQLSISKRRTQVGDSEVESRVVRSRQRWEGLRSSAGQYDYV